MFRGFVGTVNVDELDGVAAHHLHHVALSGVRKRFGHYGIEGREGVDAHLAACGGQLLVGRILTRQIGEILTRRHRFETVGQFLGGIRKHDHFQTERIGSHAALHHTGHRPDVVLQLRAEHLARDERLGLFAQLRRRHITVGDLAVAILTHEEFHVLRGVELLADGTHLLFEVQHIVVRSVHLEDHVRQHARRRLLEHLLMGVVERLDLARRDAHQRIGHRRITLGDVLPAEDLVGRIDAVLDFEFVDIGALADQRGVFLHGAFQPGLLVQVVPRLLRAGVGSGLRQELRHGGSVVSPRTRIAESRIEGLRRDLAADHVQTLLLGNLDTHPLEAGDEHMVGEKRLPRRGGQLVGLLIGRSLYAAVAVLDGVVLIQILGVADLVAVDHADLRIVVREAHVGLQRQNECQEGECDNHRQKRAELGP